MMEKNRWLGLGRDWNARPEGTLLRFTHKSFGAVINLGNQLTSAAVPESRLPTKAYRKLRPSEERRTN